MIARSPCVRGGEEEEGEEDEQVAPLHERHQLEVVVALDLDGVACGVGDEPGEPEPDEDVDDL